VSIERPRVVLADDGVLVREGVVRLLTAGGCEVLAALEDAEGVDDALRSYNDLDTLVLDIRMPPTHTDEGLGVLERLRADGISTGVLLLSMYASPTLAMRALSAGGATGYLLKDRIRDGQALVEAVRTVARGGTVVDPEIVALLLQGSASASRLDVLSAREREVLALMAEGRSNQGIAKELKLATKTVDSHVEHLLTKMGLEASADEHRRVLAVLELLRARDVGS
jgi:DNA-binding NarL/FixJ family response regulator